MKLNQISASFVDFHALDHDKNSITLGNIELWLEADQSELMCDHLNIDSNYDKDNNDLNICITLRVFA